MKIERVTVERVLARFDEEKKQREKNRIVLITFPELYELVDKEGRELIDRLRSTDPRPYGFKGEHFGEQPEPEKLLPIKGVGAKVKTQYLPVHIHKAFLKMRTALREDINNDLVCYSGYRTQAYQAVAFLFNYKYYGFDLEKTFRFSALPGYSEHNLPRETALDLQGERYDPEVGFETTSQYGWLKKRANEFGFYESYPEDNELGVVWEPWHWRFRDSFDRMKVPRQS